MSDEKGCREAFEAWAVAHGFDVEMFDAHTYVDMETRRAWFGWSSRPAPKVEDLVKALEPFAALAEVFDQPGGTQPTFGPIHEWSRMVDGAPKDYSLTVEMLREARAALAAYRKD